MSITNEQELAEMRKAGEAVAYMLREMTKYGRPGLLLTLPTDFPAGPPSVSKTSFAMESLAHQEF